MPIVPPIYCRKPTIQTTKEFATMRKSVRKEYRPMNKTVRNILIGVGIGLLIAPGPGRETVERLRTSLQRFGEGLLPRQTPPASSETPETENKEAEQPTV